MSIERTKKGLWRVRWREGPKGATRNRAKVIGRKADAILYEQEIKRAQRMGTLAHMEMGTDTLRDFARDEYWPNHVARQSHRTQVHYAYLIDKHIMPYLGGLILAQITAQETERWLGELERRKVGRRAQAQARTILLAILNKAVAWQKLATNPASYSESPKVVKLPVKPPTPLQVEGIREALIALGRPGDAVFVSALAYAGLRPQEAQALKWADIGERTIVIHSPKVNRNRAVPLLAPLAKDLADWRKATQDRWEYVFPNRNGERMTDNGYAEWRRRVWPQVCGEVKKPYWLRHAFVSLLIRDPAYSPGRVAQVAGHSLKTCLETYAHVFEELQGAGSTEDEIRKARVREAQKVVDL